MTDDGRVNQAGDFAEAIDTGLQGYIDGCTGLELAAVLGQPLRAADKSQAEWTIRTVFGVATLYDYKAYATPWEEVEEWHVGGGHPGVVHEVAQYLRNRGIGATIREELAWSSTRR